MQSKLNCRPELSAKALCRRKGWSGGGFTLIELLVVIAIIAILAAILFPVFARARENARRASCSSNLKQVGLGIMQYSQDYDEKYPTRERADGGDGAIFSQLVQPYVKSTQLFKCPSNTSNVAEITARGGFPAVALDYAYNYRFARGPGESGISLAGVNSTASKIIISERRSQWTNGGMAWPDWGINWDNEGFANHLGTMNCLFGDGHVKAMRPTQTIQGVNMWGATNDSTFNTPNCATPDQWNQAAVNCDDVAPSLKLGLEALQKRYQ